jgi:hypothetical protein
MKKTLLVLIAGLVCSSASFAGDSKDMDKSIIYEDVKPRKKVHYKFNANEWNADVFAVAVFQDDSGTYPDGAGGGLGLSYFFTRFFGAGIDAYGWSGNEGAAAASGNLIARLPIESWSLAPYVFGGITGGIAPETSAGGHGGAGLEWRITDKWGLFGDSRFVSTDTLNDFVVSRLGLRLVF